MKQILSVIALYKRNIRHLTVLQKLNYTVHIIVINHVLAVLRDKSSARSNFMSWFSKCFTANKETVSQRHHRPRFLIELKFHKSHTNNADATWLSRHVPSTASVKKSYPYVICKKIFPF